MPYELTLTAILALIFTCILMFTLTLTDQITSLHLFLAHRQFFTSIELIDHLRAAFQRALSHPDPNQSVLRYTHSLSLSYTRYNILPPTQTDFHRFLHALKQWINVDYGGISATPDTLNAFKELLEEVDQSPLGMHVRKREGESECERVRME